MGQKANKVFSNLIKKVMSGNFLKNTAHWRNFLMARVFSPKCVAVALKTRGYVALKICGYVALKLCGANAIARIFFS